MLAPTVTVPPPEEPFNVTVSAATGWVVLLAPPEDRDQWVSSVLSHVPVPLIQYLAVIFYFLNEVLNIYQ
jgi:hypothetical protein